VRNAFLLLVGVALSAQLLGLEVIPGACIAGAVPA
jgi:Kef-type K+ transport system membrane component KefB